MQTVVVGSNSLRLRFVAIAAGVAGVLVLAEVTARFAAGISPILAPASWVDRLALLLEPLIGIVGFCAGVGLWKRRRWGATAFTAWVGLILAQVAVTAFLVAALAAFAGRGLFNSVLLLLFSFFVALLVIRLVRRWLFESIASGATVA